MDTERTPRAMSELQVSKRAHKNDSLYHTMFDHKVEGSLYTPGRRGIATSDGNKLVVITRQGMDCSDEGQSVDMVKCFKLSKEL